MYHKYLFGTDAMLLVTKKNDLEAENRKTFSRNSRFPLIRSHGINVKHFWIILRLYLEKVNDMFLISLSLASRSRILKALCGLDIYGSLEKALWWPWSTLIAPTCRHDIVGHIDDFYFFFSNLLHDHSKLLKFSSNTIIYTA